MEGRGIFLFFSPDQASGFCARKRRCSGLPGMEACRRPGNVSLPPLAQEFRGVLRRIVARRVRKSTDR